MLRPFALVTTLAFLAAGCVFDPPGDCTVDGQCGFGGRCAEGVCIWGCADDSHCEPFETCDLAARECAVNPGRCSSEAHCAIWESCDASNTCVLDPGSCAAEEHCADWESCELTTHTCEPRAGRCSDAADCASYETCDPAHVCVLAAGRCTDASHCDAWETCTRNSCTAAAGRCNAVSDCEGLWAACSSEHYCTQTPGDQDVALMGTISPGSGGYAVSRITSPDRVLVGFPGGFDHQFTGDGRLIYWQGGKLRVFVADSMSFVDGRWRYPDAPEANDGTLPTTPCDDLAGPSEVRSQQDSQRILYNCINESPKAWYDTDGAVVIPAGVTEDIQAWNAAGYILHSKPGFGLAIRSPDGTVTVVTGATGTYQDARADGNAFLMTTHDGTKLMLYRISALAQQHEGTLVRPRRELLRGFRSPRHRRKCDRPLHAGWGHRHHRPRRREHAGGRERVHRARVQAVERDLR